MNAGMRAPLNHGPGYCGISMANSNWKSLNFNERQLFNKIRSQFIEEWLLVKPSLDQNEAQQIIQQALLQSAEKDDRN